MRIETQFFGSLSAIVATVFENGFGCVLLLMVISRAQFHLEKTHVRISNVGRLSIFCNCDGIFQVIYSKFKHKREVICIFKGPFIYYVITCRGEGGQKMPIFDYFQY